MPAVADDEEGPEALLVPGLLRAKVARHGDHAEGKHPRGGRADRSVHSPVRVRLVARGRLPGGRVVREVPLARRAGNVEDLNDPVVQRVRDEEGTTVPAARVRTVEILPTAGTVKGRHGVVQFVHNFNNTYAKKKERGGFVSSWFFEQKEEEELCAPYFLVDNGAR